MKNLGQRLRLRRQQLGLSQAVLAARAGLPQSRLSDFENGTRTSMTLITALRIARALGVGIDYLAGTFEEDETTATAEAAALAAETPRRGRPRKAAPLASASG